jgi:hypothetical protein
MSRQSLQQTVACVGGAAVISSLHDFLAVYHVSATTISQHQLSIVSKCSNHPSAQHAHRDTCPNEERSSRRRQKRFGRVSPPWRAVDRLMIRRSYPQAFFAVVSGLRPQNHIFSSFRPSSCTHRQIRRTCHATVFYPADLPIRTGL